jgi:hypothetical protein
MVPTAKRRAVLALVCAVLLLAGAGCLSLAEDSIPKEVEQQLEEVEPLETLTGVQNISYTFEGEEVLRIAESIDC